LDPAVLGLCRSSSAAALLERTTMEADEQGEVVEAHAHIDVTVENPRKSVAKKFRFLKAKS
jgi:hypothetical protein